MLGTFLSSAYLSQNRFFFLISFTNTLRVPKSFDPDQAQYFVWPGFKLLAKVLFVCFVALHPKSTAMVMAGWSVHLTTLFPGQA